MTLAVASVTFISVHLVSPNLAYEIALARYGDTSIDTDAVARIRAEAGLDRPLAIQYANWIGRLMRFDLGYSLVDGRRVSDLVMEHARVTILLAAISLPLSWVFAIPLGLVSGFRPGTVADIASRLVSALLIAIPSFVVGIVLIWLLSIEAKLVPLFGAGVLQFVLPGVTLALSFVALSSRVVAASVLRVRTAGYFHFGAWKGLSLATVLRRHGVRNMAVPLVAVVGLQFGHMLEGAVIVETLFALPGVGRLMLSSVLARDIPVIQGLVLLATLGYVASATAVDLIVSRLSPGRLENP